MCFYVACTDCTGQLHVQFLSWFDVHHGMDKWIIHDTPCLFCLGVFSIGKAKHVNVQCSITMSVRTLERTTADGQKSNQPVDVVKNVQFFKPHQMMKKIRSHWGGVTFCFFKNNFLSMLNYHPEARLAGFCRSKTKRCAVGGPLNHQAPGVIRTVQLSA